MRKDLPITSYADTGPSIVVESRSVEVDPVELRRTMQGIGISEAGIGQTAIVVDGKNRTSYNGSQAPKWVDRLTHGVHPYNQGKGTVIRLGTKVRGKNRSLEDINDTLVHELEHTVQYDKRDKSLLIGNMLIYGGSFALAALVDVLARKAGVKHRSLASVGGFVLGNRIGYQLAPHENQARQRARELKTSAIKSSLGK